MIPIIDFKSKNVLDDIEQAYTTVGSQFLKIAYPNRKERH